MGRAVIAVLVILSVKRSCHNASLNVEKLTGPNIQSPFCQYLLMLGGNPQHKLRYLTPKFYLVKGTSLT